jgi:YgiT-type zinc finger domain-containing protein
MDEWSREKTVKYGEEVVHVHGYLSWVCNSCGGEIITQQQFRSNRNLLIEASGIPIDPTLPAPL